MASGLNVNPSTPELWQSNALVTGRNRLYQTRQMKGTLSIKSVLNGEAAWGTPDGRYRVSADQYLVLNDGQTYAVDLKSAETVQTHCIFFQPGFVEGLWDALRQDGEGLLDSSPTPSPVGFYERLNPNDPLVTPRLRAFVGARERDLTAWEAEEMFLQLGEALVRSQFDARQASLRLDLVQVGVREEIFSRLNLARDYILQNLDRRFGLSDVAGAASLSPFHFHRLFKAAFGATPHQFVTQQRLVRAERLLRTTDLDLGTICLQLGFESVPSFCHLAKRNWGCSPTQVRNSQDPITAA